MSSLCTVPVASALTTTVLEVAISAAPVARRSSRPVATTARTPWYRAMSHEALSGPRERTALTSDAD